MFEVEYLCNGWVNKGEVNANLVFCDWPNFKYPLIDFAFCPRLSVIDVGVVRFKILLRITSSIRLLEHRRSQGVSPGGPPLTQLKCYQ